MAVPKDKVLSSLKAKLKGKNASKTYLEKTADRFAPKIENEADIDEYIDDRLEDMIDAIAEADRRVTLATKKTETENPKPGTGGKVEDPDEDEDFKDAPAYVKAILKNQKVLEAKLETMEASKTHDTLKDRFLKDERLAGIPAKLLAKWVPTKEEDFEAAVEATAEDLKDFVVIQDEEEDARPVPLKALGTKSIGKPPVIGKKAGDTKTKEPKVATAEEIAGVMPGLMPSYKAPASIK